MGSVINDGAEYIKWELSYAQGLQYEMIYWINQGYDIQKIESEHGERSGDESLNEVFSDEI